MTREEQRKEAKSLAIYFEALKKIIKSQLFKFINELKFQTKAWERSVPKPASRHISAGPVPGEAKKQRHELEQTQCEQRRQRSLRKSHENFRKD